MLRAGVVLLLVFACLPGPAWGSQLIDRNASGVQLAVDSSGRALLTYTAAGAVKHVLVYGAVDALPPSETAPQVEFKVDYSGGWGSFHKVLWKSFKNVCTPYTGPHIPLLLTACTAPDGSYWAVQQWQRGLPDLGFTPWQSLQSARELRISHWTGPIAALDVHAYWIGSGRYQEIFGTMTYNGVPVHGFKTTAAGVPLDSYGRNLYLDTYNSVYGKGWWRENGFVSHNPNGSFCYGLFKVKVSAYPHPPSVAAASTRGPGTGTRYRITVIGPGVTPDVQWEGAGLGKYRASNPADVKLKQEGAAALKALSAADGACKPH